MRKSLAFLMIMAAVVFLAAPAVADWDPGDGHKMHYPQLPDPQGWDVNFEAPVVVADDWKCSRSGPVSDIHIWLSCRDEDLFPEAESIHLSIHADDRTGEFSKPGDLLWEQDVNPDDFTLREYGSGDQGWFDPTGEMVPNDHKLIWQANLVNIPDPFPQERGEIYWLDVSVKTETVPGTTPEPKLGWKTSRSPHFEDNAVWAIDDGSGLLGWQPLFDPRTGESLDMAFVITPEPGTLVMLAGAGLIGLLGFVGRRRKGGA
jgi:hypothetical protein